MTLAGMVTSAVSILIVPVSSTVTGVLSARGRLVTLSLSESFEYCPSFCGVGVGAGAGLRPDCAELDELKAQTNPATNRIATRQRANKLLFIIPPLKLPGIAAHSCLWASGNSQLTEATRPGRGALPRYFCSFEIRSDGKGRNRRAGFIHHFPYYICLSPLRALAALAMTNGKRKIENGK